ncbi:MAG: peptide chain release factor N(5)-glutamine methyltransferase [Saprospiraceae bacterium]|nr:peptide chain release factor N(5)-glutamine methyltransferase [Bacteroidia bacterium]NNE16747.1 peptide chain release factor N(5)-glutamine methyltransferase [Saprospiraceae bacterium]
MEVDILSKYKKAMVASLSKTFDKHEAQSITDYYFDGKVVLEDSLSEIKIEEDINRINSGEPIQYVTGLSFFYGYHFLLNHQVLIPRPETEELVYWIEKDCKPKHGLDILDIGCGSGCILLSLMLKLNAAKGTGWDISEDALKNTEENASKYNLDVSLEKFDVLNDDMNSLRNKYDVVVCNPPYILKSEVDRMGENVVRYEPHEALFVDDANPLIFYQKVISNLPNLLSQNGCAYFETSDLYHESMELFLKDTDYKFEFKKDMQGNWRMLKVW